MGMAFGYTYIPLKENLSQERESRKCKFLEPSLCLIGNHWGLNWIKLDQDEAGLV